MSEKATEWFYMGIVVRGTRSAIEKYRKNVQAEFELVIISRRVSSSFLKITEGDD